MEGRFAQFLDKRNEKSPPKVRKAQMKLKMVSQKTEMPEDDWEVLEKR